MTAITMARLAALTPGEGAALWLVQQDAGTPVEAGLFERWLALSVENREAWHSAERVWDLFDDADDPAFAALRQAALLDVVTPHRAGWAPGWRSIAAGALVIATVAAALQFSRPEHGGDARIASSNPQTPWERTYTSPMGASTDQMLPDGTRLTLESNSAARVRMSSGRRHVVMDRGNGIFAVTHDASRPFMVSAGGRTIVDVGTRFRISLGHDRMTVALFEGSVRVDGSPGGAKTLKPGQQLTARVGRPDAIAPIASGDGSKGQLAQFDDVTLADATETVNEGSAVKLVITDPAVAKLRVSGQFRLRDPERFARTVSQLLPLRVVRVSATRFELRRAR